MRALARVRVFVEMGAIKLGEAVSVSWEVRGGPIEKDADTRLVAAVDKFHEFGGSAGAAGGSEVAEGLVAPGTIEGMFPDGGEVGVGVAEIFQVGDGVGAEVAIADAAVGNFRGVAA